MLESLPVSIAIGTILGFLSGLGIGGGSLLIIWLTMILGLDQPVARGINLLFFIPSSAAAICFRWKQGDIPWIKISPAILGGCLAALAFSWLGKNMDTDLLKKLFGILLLITGVRELLYRPRNAR